MSITREEVKDFPVKWAQLRRKETKIDFHRDNLCQNHITQTICMFWIVVALLQIQ